MQQIKIEMIGFQSSQAALARRNRPPPRRMMRQNFAHQKNLIPPPINRFANQMLRRAAPIQLGRIDHAHPQLQSQPQRRNLGLAPIRILAHVPRSLPKHRHFFTRRELSRAYRSFDHGKSFSQYQRTFNTTLPGTCPASMRWCALAASSRSNAAPITTLISPSSTALLSFANSRTPGTASYVRTLIPLRFFGSGSTPLG